MENNILPQEISTPNKIEVQAQEPLKNKPKLDSWKNIAIVSFLLFLLVGFVGQNNKGLAVTFSSVFLVFLVVVIVYKINKKLSLYKQREAVFSVRNVAPEEVFQKPSPNTESSVSPRQPLWVKIIAVYNLLIMVFYVGYFQIILLGFSIGKLLIGIIGISDLIGAGIMFTLSGALVGFSLDTTRKAFQKNYEFKNSDKYFMFLPTLFLLLLCLFFYYQYHFNLLWLS